MYIIKTFNASIENCKETMQKDFLRVVSFWNILSSYPYQKLFLCKSIDLAQR